MNNGGCKHLPLFTIHYSLLIINCFKFLKLVIKHESGDYAGGKVGDRHTEPNAVYAPEERQDEQKRDEYHHLAAQRKPRAERSIKVWSVVKAFATSSGISSPTKNPVVVTIVAAMTVIFITWFTRWYWRAP